MVARDMSLATRTLFVLGLVVLSTVLATAAEPKLSHDVHLSAPLEIPGRKIVGRKVVYSGAASQDYSAASSSASGPRRIIYKYVKLSSPPPGVSLEDHMAAHSLAETGETTGRRVEVSPENAQLFLQARAEELLADTTATTPEGGGMKGVEYNSPPKPPASKPTGFVAFWTEGLMFSNTALALVFIAAALIGVALGATYRSYVSTKEDIEQQTKKFASFAVD